MISPYSLHIFQFLLKYPIMLEVKIHPEIEISEKLSILPITADHKPEIAQEATEVTARVLEGATDLAVEYFPHELVLLVRFAGKDLVEGNTNFKETYPFFTEITNKAKDQNKSVYVFDPANDVNFSLIAYTPNVLPVIAAGYGIGVTAALVQERIQATKRMQPMTRRGFLRGTGGILTAFLVASTSIWGPIYTSAYEQITQQPASIPSEQRFRRVVIAKGITNLGDRLVANPNVAAKKIALVYPPTHWAGINELLADRTKLNMEFTAYSALKVIPSLRHSFFRMREYSHQGNSWNLVQSQEI